MASVRLEDLTPDTREVAERFISKAASQGLRLKVVSTLRSCADQAKIYGSNKPGATVTGAKGCRSWHVWGRAFDVLIQDSGSLVTSAADPRYDVLGELGESMGLVWGGRFSWGKDAGHFEFHPGMDIKDRCPDRSDEACQRQIDSFGGNPKENNMATCQPRVLSDHELASKIHLTFLREWVRGTIGQTALRDLDKSIIRGQEVNVPDEVDREISDALIAMDDGVVIPGIWMDQEGNCYHDWSRTACFARWYMLSTPEEKQSIRELLATGNGAPWLSLPSTVLPCEQGEAMSGCCPSDVWADPVYIDAAETKSKTSIWTIGIAAVILGISAAYIRKVAK